MKFCLGLTTIYAASTSPWTDFLTEVNKRNRVFPRRNQRPPAVTKATLQVVGHRFSFDPEMDALP